MTENIKKARREAIEHISYWIFGIATGWVIGVYMGAILL